MDWRTVIGTTTTEAPPAGTRPKFLIAKQTKKGNSEKGCFSDTKGWTNEVVGLTGTVHNTAAYADVELFHWLTELYKKTAFAWSGTIIRDKDRATANTHSPRYCYSEGPTNKEGAMWMHVPLKRKCMKRSFFVFIPSNVPQDLHTQENWWRFPCWTEVCCLSLVLNIPNNAKSFLALPSNFCAKYTRKIASLILWNGSGSFTSSTCCNHCEQNLRESLFAFDEIQSTVRANFKSQGKEVHLAVASFIGTQLALYGDLQMYRFYLVTSHLEIPWHLAGINEKRLGRSQNSLQWCLVVCSVRWTPLTLDS